jgi:hypothetical protein
MESKQRNSPFSPLQRADMVVLHFLFRYDHSTKFVDAMIREHCSQSPPSSMPRLQWSQWGPQNTRCFDDLIGQDEIKQGISPNYNHLVTPTTVYDFNSLTIVRDISRGQLEGIFSRPSVITSKNAPDKLPSIFEEDIVSTLPFRKLGHRIPTEVGGIEEGTVRKIYFAEQSLLMLEIHILDDQRQKMIMHTYL